jgi:hypothetical protein
MEPNKLAKQFLQELRFNPLFKEAMAEVKKFRPVVPEYKPCQSREEADSLMEKIKYESGRKDGFELIYLLLTGDRTNE